MRILLTIVLRRVSQILRRILSKHPTNPPIRRINPRRHTARRENIAVLDPARSRHPVHIRPRGRRPRPTELVGGSVSPVEHAGARHNCGAGADGNEPAQFGVHGPHEVDFCGHVVACAAAAGDDEDFDVALLCGTVGIVGVFVQVVVECHGRDDLLGEVAACHAGCHGIESLGEDGEVCRGVVEHVEVVEDVDWAEDVEGLEVWED